jgi:predicted RNA binding protein YcfA (HicA-like mRNA interferase family)
LGRQELVLLAGAGWALAVYIVTTFGYYRIVKVSELRRWLKKQGCSFSEESRHTRIVLGSKVSRMPRHPSKGIKTGTLQSILKDLDLTK